MNKKQLLLKILGLVIIVLASSCEVPLFKIEEMSTNYCKCLETSNITDESSRLSACFQTNVAKPLSVLQDDSLYNVNVRKIEILTLENCPAYSALAEVFYKGDWKLLNENPDSRLSANDCAIFKEQQSFFYFGTDDMKSIVNIGASTWEERFENGQESYLNLEWDETEPCAFEISFVSSTNPEKNNMFEPGDKFFYRVIDRDQNSYVMTSTYQGRTYEFKMFFE